MGLKYIQNKDYDFPGRIIVQQKVQPKQVLIVKLKETRKPIGKKAIPPTNLEELCDRQESIYPILRLRIKRNLFELMKDGRLDLSFHNKTSHNQEMLMSNQGVILKYIYVKYCCDKDWLIAEYESCKRSEYDFEVDIEGVKIKIAEGDFVVKIGNVITVNN